jgi:acyl carrier protein
MIDLVTTAEFLHKVEDILEEESGTLKPAMLLDGQVDGWDSMGVVSFMALVDERFGETLSPEKLDEAKTVQDLLDLVAHHLKD